MKILINNQKWHECDEEFALNLSACTNNPNILFKLDKIPDQLTLMKGIKEFYTSGYGNIETIEQNNLSAFGEFVAVRKDNDLNKAYNFIFGKHENGKLYYNGPHKYFDSHHFKEKSQMKISGLFGHINKRKLKR
jgi:hypothetical protein